MSWIQFQIHTTNEAVEPVTNILLEAGITGIEIDDGWSNADDEPTYIDELGQIMPIPHTDLHHSTVIKVYLVHNEHVTETIDQLKQSVISLKEYGIHLGNYSFAEKEVFEEDWATSWEKYYKPVHITDTLTVTPTWESYQPRSHEETVIELDPGMAFGTGTHETTTLCMKALEKNVKHGDVVIDLGCGSGILSITSVKLGAKRVFAYDLDEIAVKSTRENSEINGVRDQITVKHQDLLNNVHHQVDIVVSNILAEVIIKATPAIKKVLKDNGVFIASGIIDSKLNEVKDILRDNRFTITEVTHDGHWVSVVSTKNADKKFYLKG